MLNFKTLVILGNMATRITSYQPQAPPAAIQGKAAIIAAHRTELDTHTSEGQNLIVTVAPATFAIKLP